MPSSDDSSLPLSALQHFAFCQRQCAFIHIEHQWAENRLTAEGRVLHDKAHEAGSESRRDLRIVRALPLQSATLRLHGVADIVEFRRRPDSTWQPFPVEYKRGRPKHEATDSIQLCAQALCLEEMLGIDVPAGAIFYGAAQRRHDIAFDASLRTETRRVTAATHALVASGRTPPPEFGPKCHACSFLELCRPEAITRSASRYLDRLMNPAD